MVKLFHESGWKIYPAGGITGEAFLALHENEKLFLKRNSSPFLAVLSAEGIVPKLLWSRRLENGDVITAQVWVKGRILEPSDMNSPSVARMLRKIHRSKILLSMLRRLGKSPSSPDSLVNRLEKQFPDELLRHPNVNRAFQYLKHHVPQVLSHEWTVCHGDLNHNNWIVTEEGELYLIDWDNAAICDYAFDLGPLLYWYIPETDWAEWLSHYGVTPDSRLFFRMRWYALYQTLSSILFFSEKRMEEERNFWMDYLGMIL